jgi:hypothetical protein
MRKDAKITKIGYDEEDREVAVKYECTASDCNCIGYWYSGNPEWAVRWESVNNNKENNNEQTS